MMRPNGTEKQIRPAGWQPGANTIAYYPLKINTADETGNTTPTIVGAVKETIGYSVEDFGIQLQSINAKYMGMWINVQSYNKEFLQCCLPVGGYIGHYLKHNNSNLNKKFFVFYTSSLTSVSSSQVNISTNTWHHFAVSLGSTNYFFFDGQPYYNTANQPYAPSADAIVFRTSGRGSTDTAIVSDVIIEDVVWSAQEVLDYYNQTKGDYGIS